LVLSWPFDFSGFKWARRNAGPGTTKGKGKQIRLLGQGLDRNPGLQVIPLKLL